MIRAAAFVGALADLRFVRQDRTLRAEISLPIQDFEGFRATIGLPPSAVEHGGQHQDAPAVAILPCHAARHPQRDADVLADAALALLEALIEAKDLRIDVRRARRIEALANAVPFQPLHVDRDPT